nr:two-component regulator propeller domain-containing protein [uncultured Flavobacterium sp.]
MKTLKIIVVFIFLTSFSARSQSARLYTTDSQISSSLINKIFQDSKGYIWIATEDGLNRYDGSKFLIYKQIKNNPTSILNNFIKSIFEDKNKNLFFGFINGLQIYNHATDSFKEISFNGNINFNPHVSCIMQRRNGTVLVGTSGFGIFEVDMKNPEPTAKSLQISIPSSLIHDFFEDQNQNIWILTQDKGLFLIDKKNNIKQFFMSKTHLTNISSICEDKLGNLYVAGLTDGLFVYNKGEKRFTSIAASASLPIKKIILDKNNKILLATDGTGLHVFDPVSKKISSNNFNVSSFDFSVSKVHSVLEDKAGNLWLGLYQKGILLLPTKENNFNYLGPQSVRNNVIGSNCVMSVYKDKKGILWVGTDGDGLYGISSKNEKKYHYSIDKKQKGRLTVTRIYEDSNGDLWIGTFMHGLAKLNRKTNKLDFIYSIFDKENNLVQSISSIVEDHNKRLWIGSMGGGLYSLDLNTQKISAIDSNPTDSSILGNKYINKYINCLLVGQNDKLYIGTFDGLYCLDLKTKTYIKEKGLNHTFVEKVIYTVHEDSIGNLWIGTSEGLIYQPKGRKTTKTYTIEDNLPSNIICAIEKDKHNDVWISTNHGIAKFDSRKQKFINFYFNDGLQGNEFSKNASFRDNDSLIIFGGMKGVTYFNPDKIKYNGKSSNVYITGIYIQDKSVKKGMKSGRFDIVDSALIDAKTIDLSNEDNSFSIEFSTMDFNNQQHITYSYSLGNDNWNKLQQDINTVTFDNLEPGTYNFQVKAENYGKSSDIRQLCIIIHPVWYFSFVAKCIYIMIFLIIVYIVMQQVKQKKATQLKIQEHLQNKRINEAKLQFLANISHDIKSPISLVINPLQKLMNTDKDSIRQKSYRVMYRNSERIMQLVNQALDIRKIDQGQISLTFKETEIISYIRELCFLFEDQIQTKKIQIRLHNSKPSLYAFVDPEYFDKIIQNVISNAVKFVPEGGRIDIFVKEEENSRANKKNNSRNFIVTIADNGIGVNEKEMELIFDRFYQASSTVAYESEGTGIGLHLTKSIVELHNGSIRAENNSDGLGCRFIITIPLTNGCTKAEILEINSKNHNDSFQSNELIIALKDQEEQLANYVQSNRKILVVDDNDEIREYIHKELSTHYKVSTSTNGQDALAMVLNEPFDLIISDVKMPKMDGVTFCRNIKKNINVNHIPIILLTARSQSQDQIEGLNMGADAYITKPFNMEVLKKTAINLIKTRDLLKNNYSGSQAQADKIKKIKMVSADEKLIEKVMNFINKNLSNTSLNVEMIASDIGISRVHLHRKLKELTSQSTRDLIRNVRLKQAGVLLADKHTNISEVAYLVGFSNISKFSTSFKEFYGVSPKTFMEENLKKNNLEKKEIDENGVQDIIS